MMITEFTNEIENYALSLFPHCRIKAQVRRNLGQFISIDFGLIGDKKDFINGYSDNDLIGMRLIIHLNGQNNDEFTILPKKISIEMLTGWSLNINPPEESYLAIGSHGLKWRNKTARPELVLIAVLAHFERMRKAVDEERNNNNIYRQDSLDKKYFQ